MADWAFVGCPAKLGHIVKTGPITGKPWEITPRGVWIDADDAAELTDIIEDIWCFRINGYLPTHTVFYLNADMDQVAQRPL